MKLDEKIIYSNKPDKSESPLSANITVHNGSFVEFYVRYVKAEPPKDEVEQIRDRMYNRTLSGFGYKSNDVTIEDEKYVRELYEFLHTYFGKQKKK